jgi:hypothetical protein
MSEDGRTITREISRLIIAQSNKGTTKETKKIPKEKEKKKKTFCPWNNARCSWLITLDAAKEKEKRVDTNVWSPPSNQFYKPTQ